jgi:hypothetical protein
MQRRKPRTLGATYAMGQIVYPRVTDPGGVDLSWMIGRHIAKVSFQEPVSWTFYFGEKGYINAECPWRILNQGRTTRGSDDHGQQYGLPAPIDAAAEAATLLSNLVIDGAQLRVGTSDILIDFSGNLRLEILPISSGYEGWQMMNPFGTEFFAQGGGQISILRTDV